MINFSGFFIFLSSRSSSILDIKDSDRPPIESSSSLPVRERGGGSEGRSEGGEGGREG